tara:strand:- start:16285 stop:17121 length:837 start_codon:yes stop_codon:yes gene_type:complete
MIQNTYKYVSRFYKLLDVKFYHNFYIKNLFKDLRFSTDDVTNKLLKNYGILFRNIENGFTLIYKSDPKFESLSFGGELNLTFYFQIKNSNFLNITDIPFTNNQKLTFKNSQDQTNEKLHSNFFVDKQNIEPSEQEGVTGKISLTINSKDQFFGSNTSEFDKSELTYSIHFNTRLIKFRYNFFSNDQNIDFDRYFITDEQNTIKLKGYKHRILKNGTSVHSILIDKDTLASEKYSTKLYLRKEDDFLTYFSIFLPFPKASNISYDIDEKMFVNDVFVKI